MMKSLRGSKTFKIGFSIVLFFLLIAIFAKNISPYAPNEMFESYLEPSKDHILGTNDLGNDILSEIIFGTRVSLYIGFFAAFIITGMGLLLGMMSGYFGGFVEKIIVAITNIAMAIPSLPLTMLLIAFMKPGKNNIIIAMSITGWTSICRIIRAKTKEIKEQPYIKIEKTLGVKNSIILFKHIFPNLVDIVMIRGSLSVAYSMLTESSLSFLGLGTFGEKSWGSILRFAFFRNSILKGQIWWYLPPIICITTVVLGFILMGYYGNENEK